MSRRDNVEARCPTCHMHATLCICDLVPRLEARTRLSLLVHYREARKPTNTGLLAARCLPGSEVGIVGDRARPLALPLVRPGELGVLLSPDEDAVPLAQYAGSDQPLVLVVPDGSWRQAGKMRRRVPGLAELPCVTLPPTRTTTGSAPSRAAVGSRPLRRSRTHSASSRATVCGDRGGDARRVPRDGRSDAVAARTLRDGEVTGGIPRRRSLTIRAGRDPFAHEMALRSRR